MDISDIKPCDVNQMLKKNYTQNDFIINRVHFGRGNNYHDLETGNITEIITDNVKIWRIVNDNLEQLPDNLNNIFLNDESYLIQWNTKRSNDNIGNDMQRDQIYFYWKGENAPKGFSPLPEEIEKEFPPVERICQWSEPPAFLSIFDGRFVVNKRRESINRLYILRGELENEAHLYEVSAKFSSLRSRTSFVLIIGNSLAVIWHGAKSNSHCRKIINSIARKVFNDRNIREIIENSECEEFLKSLEGSKDDYFRAVKEEHNFDLITTTPRLFYFNSITGTFNATEITCSHENSNYPTPFPFIQAHLYTSYQPALLLLDDGFDIWLWHGWEPETMQNEHFDSEYLAAEITAEKYAHLKGGKVFKKIFAGFEPLAFINLFPTWETREDIKKIQLQRPIKGFNLTI